MTLERYLGSRAALVEKALRVRLSKNQAQPLPFLEPIPKGLRSAMLYSLMAGGKRLRPILAMAAAECLSLPGRKVLKTALALEMIHTYSLIHDDLPAMDDDDLRRGKPTNHKVFGEAAAILAGDGLLTAAFELAAENALELRVSAKQSAELIRVIAAGAGARGMVAGQALDLESEGREKKILNSRGKAGKVLERIHAHKTAALIAASLDAGAVLAGASAASRRELQRYGLSIGLAFQIVDDILDRVGDKKKLGKRGSDLENDKLTYPRVYGLDRSREMAVELIGTAKKSLKGFGKQARPLEQLADYIIERDR